MSACDNFKINKELVDCVWLFNQFSCNVMCSQLHPSTFSYIYRYYNYFGEIIPTSAHSDSFLFCVLRLICCVPDEKFIIDFVIFNLEDIVLKYAFTHVSWFRMLNFWHFYFHVYMISHCLKKNNKIFVFRYKILFWIYQEDGKRDLHKKELLNL